MKVTWDDTYDSLTENEEEKKVANMCFMAIDEDKVYFSNEGFKPTYIELENVFDDLHCQFLKHNA